MSAPEWMPDPGLADECVPVAAMLIISYLRPDGSRGYNVTVKGDAPMLTYLGMTVIAQQEVITWSSMATEDDL
jgi:hypothetical protein